MTTDDIDATERSINCWLKDDICYCVELGETALKLVDQLRACRKERHDWHNVQREIEQRTIARCKEAIPRWLLHRDEVLQAIDSAEVKPCE